MRTTLPEEMNIHTYDTCGYDVKWLRNDDDVWESDDGAFYILDGKLMVYIDRGDYSVAQGDDVYLAEMAKKYMTMLMNSDGWDWVDIMPLPMTDEIRITDGWSRFLEPIPYAKLPSWKQWYAASKFAEAIEDAEENAIRLKEMNDGKYVITDTRGFGPLEGQNIPWDEVVYSCIKHDDWTTKGDRRWAINYNCKEGWAIACYDMGIEESFGTLNSMIGYINSHFC